MKINILFKNITSSPSVETYVEQKIGELDKYINVATHASEGKPAHRSLGEGGPAHRSLGEGGRATVEAFVEIGKTTRGQNKGDVFRAEVQIKVPGDRSIRAESVQPEIHLAIDKVKDELQRQLQSYKGKKSAKFLRGARKFKDILHFSPFPFRRRK